SADSRLNPAIRSRGTLRQDPHETAGRQDAEHRRVSGQHADIAVECLGNYAVGVACPDLALRDNEHYAQRHSASLRDSVTLLALRDSVTLLALRDSVTLLALRDSVTTARAPSPSARRPRSRRTCRRLARVRGRTCPR